MQKYFVLLLLLSLIGFVYYADALPPTPALKMINVTGVGNITSSSYNSIFTFEGIGVTISPDYSLNKLTFSVTGGSNPNELYCNTSEFFNAYNETTNDFNCVAGAGGEVNTASNVGVGHGIFKQKTGVDLELKNIAVSGDLTIGSNDTDITISYTGSVPRGGYLVAEWDQSSTKTNIGTAFVDVYTGTNSNGKAQFIDTDTFTNVRLQIEWNKIGAGTQSCKVVDIVSGTNILITLTVVSGSNDSGFVAIPSSSPNLLNVEKNYKLQCKSTTAADDPVFESASIWLK